MTIDWDGYEIYDPGVEGPLHTLPRADAKRAFTLLMQARPSRVEMLRRLLRANGVELGASDAAVQELDDWFRAAVQEDPARPGRLLPDWYSVVNDVALFLGDLMIARRPGLSWTFYTWGKKDASYQRHVIMGFDVPNKRYNVDIDGVVATYAHCILAGDEVASDELVRVLRSVEALPTASEGTGRHASR